MIKINQTFKNEIDQWTIDWSKKRTDHKVSGTLD